MSASSRRTRDLDDAVAIRLRAAGQRYTAKRRALVEVLRRARRPLTIPEIRSGQDFAQSSVYRNVMVLEQARVVHRLASAGGFARYELADDLTEHHHHLVCTSCGSVEDLPASVGLERTVRAMEGLASRSGFAARSHRVDLLGLCRNCV
jgi:Fur family ferric uptake transcriptional regulator